MRLHLHHYLLTVNLFSHCVSSSTASVAAILPSSSSTKLISTTKRTRNVSSSPPLISELEEYETYDDEDDYRKNEEWWKDPFAQFESEEEEEIPTTSTTDDEEEEDLKQSDINTNDTDDMVVNDDDDADQFSEIKDETRDSEPLLPNLESEQLLPDEDEEGEEETEGSSIITNSEKEGEDDQMQEKKQKKSNNNNMLSAGLSQSRTEQQQQQQRQQLPVSKLQQSFRRKRSATSILSATPTVPALVLQNIVRKFSPHITAVQLFLSLAIGNLALHYFQKINNTNNKRNEERSMDDEDEIDTEDNLKEEEDEEYLDEEELKRLEQLGFARPSTYFQKPPQYGTSTVEEVHTGTISEDEEEYDGVHDNSEDDDCAELDVNKSNKSKTQFNWGINSILNFGKTLRGKKDTNEDMFESTNCHNEKNNRHNMKRKQKKLSNAELQQELEAMKEKVNRVEQEKDLLEREYDSSSRKLANVQHKLNSLTQSYDHLQQNNSEDRATIENAIRAERQRASEELKRVRNAMVTVLEQERRLMRDQIMKTSDQVRSMMNEYRDDSDDGSMDDFDPNDPSM